MLAEALAAELGYTQVSREDIVHKAAENGIPEQELTHALLDPPSLLEKVGTRRSRYLALVRLALCEKVLEDNVIYHGNAGHLLLPANVRALRVRLVAPLELRAEMRGHQREGSSHATSIHDAAAEIDRIDRQRREWTQMLYGVDPLDPMLYDMVLNLHFLGIEGATELAATAARRPEFRLDDGARQALRDHLLECHVEVALASARETAGVAVRVEAHDGVVSLAGRVASPTQIAALLQVVESVDGVTRVERDGLGSPNPLV
jgi:cytidylate kinase